MIDWSNLEDVSGSIEYIPEGGICDRQLLTFKINRSQL
jgi:hypothetical protein